MRPLARLISLERALALMLKQLAPVEEARSIPLEEAGGRVLARDVRAPQDVPGFDRAAMDGYAVRAADTRGASDLQPVPLELVGVAHAGTRTPARVGRGSCVQVATGALLPEGADAVVMVERTQCRAGSVEILEPAKRDQHVARRGSDLARGARALRRGQQLNPTRIASLAAMGLAQAEVYARPRVAILPTGTEVVEVGATLEEGQVYDSNAFGLATLVRQAGGEPLRLAISTDSRESLESALGDAVSRAELVVVSGGTSAGERDLLPDVVADRGRILFHGVRVKPGRPTMAGLVDGRLVLGLPGYPTSCLVMAHLLLLPALRRMARLPEHDPVVEAVLAETVRSRPGFHQIVPVKLEKGRATSVFKDSAATSSLAEADGYVRIGEGDEQAKAGTKVLVHLF